MVVIRNANNIMYQCEVFYIGEARPDDTKKGVEALQAPLRDRYPGNVSSVEGYDVKVTVMPDIVHVKYSSGTEPDLILPISTLSICAAVRCVESAVDPSSSKFVPVHSVITAHEPDSEHPAIFATVMRRRKETTDPLQCHAFICSSTRDALHLVNATQTAHTALRRGYSPTGAMKFFVDQSTEFDRTLRVSQSANQRKSESTKMYLYHEDYDTRQYNTETKTYVTRVDDDAPRTNRISYIDNDANVTLNGESHTYYVKAGDVTFPRASPPAAGETIIVKAESQAPPPPPQVQEQTIIVDKPVIRRPPTPEPPKVKVIERPVMIDPPPMPKMEEQVIYVDKPVFKEAKWPDPPKPKIIEREVIIEPPPPPRMEPQRIVVDKPVVRDFPPPPEYPAPIVETNPVYIDPPAWPEQKAQRIIVDKPIVRPIGPAPPPPPPIIETREVVIDPPEYPRQTPHKIVVEKPVFNPPKPAPRPPTPIIEEKKVFINPPPYPEQEPQRIIVEKPVIKDPGPPPPAPPPIIIEKPVHIEAPKYQQPEPQRIIVEKPVFRDPGPPPPPPKPIIVYKTVYIDPPPWPKQEPQRIIVEKPVIRQRAPPPQQKPIIIEKPVYVDLPEPAPAPAPRIIVEKPIARTTYGLSETRRQPSAYSYHQQYARPANVRSSYVVRTVPAQSRGLRRYAWSEVGDERDYRLYGQPRDFRFRENQFMNERGFGRSIYNEEMRQTRAPNSYTYGGYRVTERRGSIG